MKFRVSMRGKVDDYILWYGVGGMQGGNWANCHVLVVSLLFDGKMVAEEEVAKVQRLFEMARYF